MAQGPSIIPQQDNKAPLARLAFNLPEPTTKSMFSLKYWRLAVRRINSLLNMQSVDAGKVGPLIISDSNSILPTMAGSGSTTTGTGNMRYTFDVTPFTSGAYDATADYSIWDVVYTNPDSNTRISWVCEIANGPHQPAGAQAPTWPEPGTVYWRALARFFFNSATVQKYRPGFDGDTFGLALDSTTGDIMVAGGFHLMDMVDSAANTTYALRNVAAVLTSLTDPKTQHWFSLNNGSQEGLALAAVYNNSSVCFVGGSPGAFLTQKFNDIAVGAANKGWMAKLNANGTVDGSFLPDGTSIPYGLVADITLDDSGNPVYIGAGANAIKKLDATNATVVGGFALDSPSFTPIHIVRGGSGVFWIGGTGGTPGGPAIEALRPIDSSNGSTIGGFTDAGFSCAFASPAVNGIGVVGGGDIIAVGVFDHYGTDAVTHIVRVDSSGTIVISFAPSISGGTLNSVYVQGDGKVLIGGSFTTIDGNSRVGFARLNSNGSLDTSFTCNTNGTVYRIRQNSGTGETYICGTFTTAGGLTRRHIARVSAAGVVLGI